jgi:sec-independent protein translocase protein TatB
MFGIGFTELLIIAVVALVVIGPERFPEMARTIGRFAWDIRRAWEDVRDTVQDEVMNFREPLEEMRKAGRDTTDMVKREVEKWKTDAEATMQDAKKEWEDAVEGAAGAAASNALPAAAGAGEQVPEETGEAESAAAPEPFRTTPAARITYFDLDGNPVERRKT